MRKWIKNLIPDKKTIETVPAVKELNLEDKSLWSFKCNPVARGVAAGLFACVIPFPQMILAALVGVLIRGNLPIALAITWVSNPVTFLPITYLTYFLGSLFVSNHRHEVVLHKFSWTFTNLSGFWNALTMWLAQLGKAFFIGLPILAFGLAFLGYGLTIGIWQIAVFLKNKSTRKK